MARLTRYDTLGEVLEIATSKTGESSAWTKEPEKTWDYSAGFAGAVTLAREGWPAGAGAVHDLRAELSAAVLREIRRDVWAFDVAGAVPDVARYLAGEPENMLAPCEEDRPARVCRVVINLAASANISAGVVKTRGAAVLALVDVLESCGTRCEIDAVRCVESTALSNGRRVADLVRVKNAADAVDVDRLAFVLCHPAMQRRILWALAHNTYPADLWQNYRPSKAFPIDLPDEHRGDIYIPGAQSDGSVTHWQNEDTARAWIFDQLRQQGITTETHAAA
jgi:hypothetical protein